MSYIHRDCEALLQQEREKIQEHEKRHDQNRAAYEKERIELYSKIQKLKNASVSVENCLSMEKKFVDLEKALDEKQTSFDTERSSLMNQIDNHEQQFDDQQQRFITYSAIQQIEFETEKSSLLDKILAMEKENDDLSKNFKAQLAEKQRSSDKALQDLNDQMAENKKLSEKIKILEKQNAQFLFQKLHEQNKGKEVLESPVTVLKGESSQSSYTGTFHSDSSRASTDDDRHVSDFSDLRQKYMQKIWFPKKQPPKKKSTTKSFSTPQQKRKPVIDKNSNTQVYNLNDFVPSVSYWYSKSTFQKKTSDSKSFTNTHHLARRNFHKKQSFRQNSSTQVYDLNHFVSHAQSLSTASYNRNEVSNPKTTNVKGPKMKWVPKKIIPVLQKEPTLSKSLVQDAASLKMENGATKQISDESEFAPKDFLSFVVQTLGY